MGLTGSRPAAGPGPQQQDTKFLYVVGPSSSGKTTLCNALAEEFRLDPSRHIKEVARNVMKTQGFSRNTVKTYDMQHAIMLAQYEAEQAVLDLKISPADNSGCALFMLSDRSAVDPVVYAATSGVADAAEMRQRLLLDPSFQNRLPLYREALFVVLSPISEWIKDDGVRSLADPSNYHAQLCSLLTELGISFVQIGEETKDLTERVKCVERHLRARRETGLRGQ